MPTTPGIPGRRASVSASTLLTSLIAPVWMDSGKIAEAELAVAVPQRGQAAIRGRARTVPAATSVRGRRWDQGAGSRCHSHGFERLEPGQHLGLQHRDGGVGGRRGRGRSTSMISCTRPPGASTTMRSDSCTASVHVVGHEHDRSAGFQPDSFQVFAQGPRGHRVEVTNGSSISSTSGSTTAKARAIPMRCCCPPDSWAGNRLAQWLSPTRSR